MELGMIGLGRMSAYMVLRQRRRQIGLRKQEPGIRAGLVQDIDLPSWGPGHHSHWTVFARAGQ
jgi:hypothetical protein